MSRRAIVREDGTVVTTPKNKRAPLATVRPLKDQLNGKSHRRRTALANLADLAAVPLPRAGARQRG